MSQQEAGMPWGTILTVLTMLAVANAWFKPFEQHPPAEVGMAMLAGSQSDPLARHSTGWTPFAKATVTPGIQTLTGNGQCTTNFVFTDAQHHIYLGQAAHCAEVADAATSKHPNACAGPTQPLGTKVTFNAHGTTYDAGQQLATGRLAYSSWRTMRQLGDTNPLRCRFNDFALVRLDPGQRRKVNPSMPYWGGPTGVSVGWMPALGHAFGFGRSSLRKDGSAYSRQAGTGMADQPELKGWVHTIVSKSPGIPGDSGSGYLDADGNAFGTLSTLSFGPLSLSNTLGDLRHELEYARAHSGIKGLKLELGTVAFNRARSEAAVQTR